ncbi:MAG: universal stress protein [Gammaproteobacteria bacterium]|nr:universal stress protein [Gammaproteobacteria bacterium]MDH5241394.1 universal stress protein [Gammaproteobacteria bacterium]MDH5261159.1 universal stress protein [Gammaproteobacteria bacterium]MDH5582918.1 universal stress protein [Gammaproteobacteria bacterium]
MKKTVLAIIEPDLFPELVAKRAARLAALYGHNLELLLCDPLLIPFGDSFIASTEAQQLADRIRQTQKEIIDDIAAAVSKDDLNVEATVLHDRPIGDAIVSRALDSEPAIVVKGTRFHSSAERATFTYTDWQLIRELLCPVWFVKNGEWKEDPIIVAAIDPTHEHDPSATVDREIVATGKTLASRFGGSLLLLHTYQSLTELGSRATWTVRPIELPIDAIDKRVRESHRRQLDEFATANDISLLDVHQLPGRTREILPAFARSHHADVVVMGAIARSAKNRRILGSTAEQVLDHLPCDIYLVRGD